jgi:hypothetical protein
MESNSGGVDLVTKYNQSNFQLLWPQLHADSLLHECKTNTAAPEQVLFGAQLSLLSLTRLVARPAASGTRTRTRLEATGSNLQPVRCHTL